MGRGLIIRFAVLFTLAMLPLGAIALWQTQRIAENAEDLALAAVLAETERAAVAERKLMRRALGAAEGLSSPAQTLYKDIPACSAMMRRFVETNKIFVFAGFIGVDGIMECSSNGKRIDYSEQRSFKRAVVRESPMFEVSRQGVATGQSVIMVSNPVQDASGLLGFVSLSVPHNLTQNLARRDVVGEGEYLTINRDGDILSSTTDLESAPGYLPANVAGADLLLRSGETFVGPSVNGNERLFAVGTMIDDEVTVVGSHPVRRVAGITNSPAVWLSMGFSVLMWMAGLVVAFVGMHRLVIRHVDAMRLAMARFTRGDRSRSNVTLDNPPTELAALEDSFNRMVTIITKAEAQTAEDLTVKTVLLREVHHRVKNNLQLIASIMNMHGRVARSPEARRLLAQLQRRVRGLATVHQTLSASAQMTYVNTKELFDSLLRELGPTMPVSGQNVSVDADIATIRMNADQAVTLSLLAAEALTNAVKHVGVPNGGRPRITVHLTHLNGAARLCIENTRGESDIDVEEDYPGSGMGQRLIEAFVSQLDGKHEVSETDDRYTFAMSFPLAEVDGEDPISWRTAPPAPARKARASEPVDEEE